MASFWHGASPRGGHRGGRSGTCRRGRVQLGPLAHRRRSWRLVHLAVAERHVDRRSGRTVADDDRRAPITDRVDS
jgi:hypothetical protein